MKVIGRLRTDDARMNEARGDLIVTMTSAEYDIWRKLTGPGDGAIALTEDLAAAFQDFKWATKAAAEGLGLIPVTK